MTGTLMGGGVLYYNAHLETVPISGRTRFMDVSPKMVEYLAKQTYAQIMNEFSGRILSPLHPYSVFVNRVASRLIQVSGMSNLNWEVHVVNAPVMNAFVLPGGKIFVFTGILGLMDNDDALAAVLGHEIAHQVARHSAEKLSWGPYLMLLKLAALLFLQDAGHATNVMMDFVLERPFSRKCETEADYIGLMLMAQACYDPNVATTFWKKMESVDKLKIPEYASTHPSNLSRIQNLNEWQEEAQRVRENSDCHQVSSLLGAFKGVKWVSW